jgi:hypothetical protein
MKKWVVNLISKATSVSSKRVAGLFIVLNLIILAYIATLAFYICPASMYDTLAILAGTLFGGTVVEAVMNKPNPSNNDRESNNDQA